MTSINNTLNQIDGIKKSPDDTLSNTDLQIKDTLGKTQSVLSALQNQDISEKKETFENQLVKLKDSIRLKSDEINYDYGDYKNRLCVGDEIYIDTFNELITGNSDIGKLYQETLDTFDNKNIQQIWKKKLMKDYFEDFVYESINKENICDSWLKLNFSDDLEYYIHAAGKSAIMHLNLDSNYLGENLGTKGMITLIESAGKTGIKSLYFYVNELGENLEIEGMIAFVETAGKTGIKSLDLGLNGLGKRLKTKGMIALVETAGKSGIKSLKLGENFLLENLEIGGMIALVESAGNSGIKKLNLREHDLSEDLKQTLKEEANKYNLNIIL